MNAQLGSFARRLWLGAQRVTDEHYGMVGLKKLIAAALLVFLFVVVPAILIVAWTVRPDTLASRIGGTIMLCAMWLAMFAWTMRAGRDEDGQTKSGR